MIEAMIAGERDSVVLADMAKGVMRKKTDRLTESPSRVTSVLITPLLCRQIIDHLDFLDGSIATLSAEICARLVPFEPQVALLTSITGISATTAQDHRGRDRSRHEPVPDRGAPVRLGGRGPGQPRVGRQEARRRHPQGRTVAAAHPDRGVTDVRLGPRAATTRRSILASPAAEARTRRRSPSPTPCSRPPGTCSAPAPSTKTLVPTTSSVVTIRPSRQSGSSAGSRPSDSSSPSTRRPHSHTSRQLHLLTHGAVPRLARPRSATALAFHRRSRKVTPERSSSVTTDGYQVRSAGLEMPRMTLVPGGADHVPRRGTGHR